MPAPDTTPARPHCARKRSPRHRCMLPGHWIHVSSRTVHGRYAFVPPQDEGELRSMMWGVVGRAQTRYHVDIAYGVVTSNHFHFILRADRPGAISTFMQYVKAGFARLTHKTYETSGPVWDGRFRSSTILDAEAEVWWLRYCMAHMTKEAIVPRPNMWPGLQCVDHLLEGTQPEGLCFDDVAWTMAKCPKDKRPFFRKVKVRIHRLTGWEQEPLHAYQAFCRQMFDDIVAEHAERQFFGLDAALALPHTFVPTEVKHSPCAAFSAMGPQSKELLKAAYEARGEGVAAVLEAVRTVARDGHTAAARAAGCDPDCPWRLLPEGFDWPPLINDALDDPPIVGPFLPPDAELPFWPKGWGPPPRVIGDG